MRISEIQTYEQLEQYLRNLSCFGSEEPTVYDFNGMVHLMLALLDNIKQHALDTELEDIGESMSQEQRAFWHKIAGFLQQ